MHEKLLEEEYTDPQLSLLLCKLCINFLYKHQLIANKNNCFMAKKIVGGTSLLSYYLLYKVGLEVALI